MCIQGNSVKMKLILPFISIAARQLLDRRRLELAFYQYAVLRFVDFYPDILALSELPLHSETLIKITPILSRSFTAKFLSKSLPVYTCMYYYLVFG